ncbi:MAG: hypothetical protein ACXADL_00975 [Candidatus Thorarchaeota archaeon]
MSPDWMFTRVAVVSIAVLGPIYFFLLMFFLPFQMTPFMDPFLDNLFHYVAAPIVFSAPWLGIIYTRRFRFANAFQLMQDTTTAVPLRWRIFYGTNAGFILTFFILPMVTAPLAIIGGLVVAGHVFYRIGIGKLGGGKPAAALGAIVALALCILPAFVMIQFMPEYLNVWNTILDAWNGFWIQIVYGVAQSLVNALSFGAPVYFVFFAAQQYERGLYERTYTDTPSGWIRAVELLIFVVFTWFYLPVIATPIGNLFLGMSWLFTSYINWISLGIVVFMILLKWRLKVADNSTMGGTTNILIVGMFLVVELFFKTNLLIVSLIIWLAFLIFAGVFLANFARASPREMY